MSTYSTRAKVCVTFPAKYTAGVANAIALVRRRTTKVISSFLFGNNGYVMHMQLWVSHMRGTSAQSDAASATTTSLVEPHEETNAPSLIGTTTLESYIYSWGPRN